MRHQCEWFDMQIQDGIMVIEYAEVIVDVKIMQEMKDAYCHISAGKPYPILADGTKVKYWTKEAREFQVEMEDSETMKAAAIIARHKAQEILYNFFTLFSKPKIPLKVFSDKSKARQWLAAWKNKEVL